VMFWAGSKIRVLVVVAALCWPDRRAGSVRSPVVS
jgi:hypothetical protein